MALGGFLTFGIGGGLPSLFPLLTGLDEASAAVIPTAPVTAYAGFTGQSEAMQFWGQYIKNRRR